MHSIELFCLIRYSQHTMLFYGGSGFCRSLEFDIHSSNYAKDLVNIYIFFNQYCLHFFNFKSYVYMSLQSCPNLPCHLWWCDLQSRAFHRRELAKGEFQWRIDTRRNIRRRSKIKRGYTLDHPVHGWPRGHTGHAR